MYARHAFIALRRGGAFFFLLLVVNPGTARAQAEATVRGQVVSADTVPVPLKGARVTLSPAGGGESRQMVTGNDGAFAFGAIRPDEYVLAAVIEGFAPREVRISVKPRDAQSFRLALDIGRVAAAINVVAQPALSSMHSPSSTMLTAERMGDMPLAQRTSLPDAIA